MIILSNGRTVKAKAPVTGSTRYIGPSAGRVPLWGNRSMTYEQLVYSQPWVYAAVRTFYLAISRLPDKVYTGREGEDRKRTRDHDLPRLLRNPYPTASGFVRKGELAFNLFTHGNHLELKVKGGPGQPPTELWPIPWPFVQELTDGIQTVGYTVQINGKTFALDTSDVIRYRLMGGRSPLEAARRTLGIEDAAMDWQMSTLERGPSLRGAFTTTEKLASNTVPRLREELQKLYGGPDGRALGLFDQGLKFESISASAGDVGLVETRKLTREEVAAIYGIPAPMIGILDHATYSNISELRRSFYVDTIAPYLTLIEETMAIQLIDPEPTWARDGLFIEFDMGEILKPDPLAEAQSILLMTNSGTTSTNENRKLKRMQPIGDPNDPENPYNRPRVPANLIDPAQAHDEADALQAATITARLISDAMTRERNTDE